MGSYTALHLHNVPVSIGRKITARTSTIGNAQEWPIFKGFQRTDCHEAPADWIMAENPQLRRILSVHDFGPQTPATEIVALEPRGADSRQAGLIDGSTQSEHLDTYRLLSDWKSNLNWRRNQPFSGISVVIVNSAPGQHDEYQTWRDDIDSDGRLTLYRSG